MKLDYEREERYLLWLGFVLGPGTKQYERVLAPFDGDAEVFFHAAEKRDLPPECGIKEELLERICASANERYMAGCFRRLQELDISAVSFRMPDYPMLLKEIYDPPPVLYYRGDLREAQLPIGIVGSRSPSDYGRSMAYRFAQELAEAGACVVSGLAYGVDCIAALGALAAEKNDFPTIAVLGCGVDTVYPSNNRDIYEKIIKRGAVVSEFLPGTPATPNHFPMRNRIISGLSRGVLVVEAAKKSGTLITVDCALDQGRDVFALPGRLTDQKSEGTNTLLRSGHAKFTAAAEDILEEYRGVGLAKKQPEPKVKKEETKTRKKTAKTAAIKTEIPEKETEALTAEQQLILSILSEGAKNFDELCEITGLSASLLNSTLTELEFSGIMKQSPGRVYSL
ncbi:MAG: DNA-protecting protein DprA [Clostridiales bacterium]|nr:DNA-protecting protein DprA [Clostridiales bacterium]